MQTGRQRIMTALAHRQPERVPFSWGFGPTWEMRQVLERYCAEQGMSFAKLAEAAEDKLIAWPAYIGPKLEAPEYVGIWGIRTLRTSYGNGHYDEFVGHPLAGMERSEELSRHHWPDVGWYDYSRLRQQVLQADPNRTRAVQVSGGNPLELYQWMTGLEESMANLAVNPDLAVAAMGRICNFLVARMELICAQIGDLVDLVFFGDDLGGQTGLLISREMYRQIVQLFHRRLATAARALAPRARFLFHSDGAVFDIISDVIASGMECMEAVQTDAAGMEVERLKSTYGSSVGFHGAISVQQLLPRGDEMSVRREVRRIVDVMNAGGGYIAAPTHAIQMGTPPANVLAMLREVLGEADFSAVCQRAAMR